MNRNEAITGLVKYAVRKELIRPEEKIWAANSMLDILKLNTFHTGAVPEQETASVSELTDI